MRASTGVRPTKSHEAHLNTTGDGPQNLCNVFLMLSLSVDSSRYQVLWSEADGPAVGSGHTRDSPIKYQDRQCQHATGVGGSLETHHTTAFLKGAGHIRVWLQSQSADSPGAPHTVLMAVDWEDRSSSRRRCAVGKI